jgi:hypothetical protein
MDGGRSSISATAECTAVGAAPLRTERRTGAHPPPARVRPPIPGTPRWHRSCGAPGLRAAMQAHAVGGCMDTWMIAAGALAVLAVGAPLLMKMLKTRDPAKVERERREQREVLEQVTTLLASVSQTVRQNEAVAIGAGSPVHDQMVQLRRRIRELFTLSAASEFDREIGFELNRAGVLKMTPEVLDGRIERAIQALRNALST